MTKEKIGLNVMQVFKVIPQDRDLYCIVNDNCPDLGGVLHKTIGQAVEYFVTNYPTLITRGIVELDLWQGMFGSAKQVPHEVFENGKAKRESRIEIQSTYFRIGRLRVAVKVESVGKSFRAPWEVLSGLQEGERGSVLAFHRSPEK